MDEGKVRTIHYYPGINYVWFLLLQVLPGLFMSLETWTVDPAGDIRLDFGGGTASDSYAGCLGQI